MARVNQSQAAACWSLLEDRVALIGSIPPVSRSQKKERKSPKNQLNLEEDVVVYGLEEGKANNVRTYSSH